MRKAAEDAADAAPPAPAAEIKTAEEWALAKGFLPEFTAPSGPSFAPPGAAVPMQPNPRFWRFSAAKAGWPIGKELTEAEFDAAVSIETIDSHTFR